MEYVRDLSQPGGLARGWSGKVDTLLGVQANLSLGPSMEGVVQAVSRYRFDGSYRPELTWAYLRHDVSPDFSWRLGRLGTEFFMLGDTRLVGYSNLTVRPPPEYYGSLVFSYIDGVDASLTRPVAGGLLRSKLYAGTSPEKTPFGHGIVWDLGGSLLLGGYADYLQGPWQIRMSHAQVRFENEMPIDTWLQAVGDPLNGIPYYNLVPGMEIARRWARFSSLGVVYDEGPLQLQLMLNQINQDSPTYTDSRACYAIAAYKLGNVAPYLGVSRVMAKADTLPSSPIPGIDDLTRFMVAQSHNDQHTVFIGARWDLKENLALKAQVDWIDGTPNSLFTFRNPKDSILGWDGHMTVFSLALDFVF